METNVDLPLYDPLTKVQERVLQETIGYSRSGHVRVEFRLSSITEGRVSSITLWSLRTEGPPVKVPVRPRKSL